ncbi:hypothetical protein [Fusibacter ferrireducens]|uniref:Uncharacterized protein n=1 Tax=Fusibacter ferrireducens TaxID=2785058 RepID=A0ABR9ZU85_9FIRM|nr:hypothetical protein [Fusibacter ferrireducens]MBF4693139.1 hypothetical protein [Fusibacter ferrireducens]
MKMKTTLHRKYVKGFILLLLLSLTLTGCLGESDYKAYHEAALKTAGIQRGGQSLSVSMDQALFAEALSNHALNGLEHVQFDLSGQFDYEKNLALYDIYYYYNGLGSDIQYIRKSESEQYIKMPLFKDYLKLDTQANVDEGMDKTAPVNGNTDVIKNIISEIHTEWHAMIQKENIFVGEKTTIKNEDGNVKATKFTIKPTTEQLALMENHIKTSLLAHSDELVNVFNSYLLQETPMAGTSMDREASTNNSGEMMKMDSDSVRKLIENSMSNMNITHYEEMAYVDLDGYIIEESTAIGIEYTQTDQFTPLFRSQEIVINSKNWGIEQTQKFDFPEIDASNSKSLEGFDFSGGMKQ